MPVSKEEAKKKQAEAEKASASLAETFGRLGSVAIGEHDFKVTALDVNDMVDAEEAFGTIDELFEMTKHPLRKFRFVLWLSLRKGDPRLSEEDKKRGKYLLTETEIGQSLDFQQIQDLAQRIISVAGDTKNGASEAEGAKA